MSTTATLSSFAETARAARALGWDSVLPLPHGQKFSPPIGYTGAEAKIPTDEDYAAWDAQAGEHFNIAVVMPENVAGLDIDVRDGKRGDALLAEMSARLGDLPPTYSITARGADSASRIYLYRRHRTGRLRGFLGGPADGGEVIQHAHRYIVGPGSLHPEGGTYTVYDPSGQPIEGLPAVADLALLSDAWEDDLAAANARATSDEAAEFIGGLPGGDYDEDTQALLDEFACRLNDEDGWGRFTDCDSSQAAMLRVTMDLAIAGACGAPGVPMALAAAEDMFVTYRASRGDSVRDAAGAWRRALAGAIGYVRENGIEPLEPFEIPADVLTVGRRVERRPRRRFADGLLSRRQLADLPSPEPLIEDTLDRRTVALLAGYHGTGKSFVALAWAASVATGTPWMGRPVHQGRVLYIVGEGAHGIDDRLSAWERATGVLIEDDALVTYPRAVQLANAAELADMVAHLAESHYDLVIIDTVARSAVGLDENSAKDIGVFIDAAEQIKRATGSGTVLLVHHTGKDKTTVRGSSALEAAMDTVYTTEGDPLNMRLRRTKRKDGPMEDSHQLRLVAAGDSCVLESLDPAVQQRVDDSSQITRAWVDIVTVFGDQVLTRTQAVSVLKDPDRLGLSQSTAYRTFNQLLMMGVFRNIGTERAPKFVADQAAAKKAKLPKVMPALPEMSGPLNFDALGEG